MKKFLLLLFVALLLVDDFAAAQVTTTPSATGVGVNLSNASSITGILPPSNGGTGRATSTTAYGLLAAGTTATGNQQTLAAGATTEILVGGGASALPVWTTAQGSGAPVRATSPTLTTPALGVATATSINFGGTALANYVEGTCTPTILLGGANVSMTYTTQACVYTRIGRMVNVIIEVAMNTKGSSTGTVTVGGLPLTANSTSTPRPACGMSFSAVGLAAQSQYSALVIPNSVTIGIYITANNGTITAMQDTATIASNTIFLLNCNYYI